MADINSWTITGRLTKDSDYRLLASGKALLTCSVAVNTGWGERKKVTYVKVQQWGEKGANLKQWLVKGKLIGASGQLTLNEWNDRDGGKHSDLVLDTPSIQLLSGAGGGLEPSHHEAEEKAAPKEESLEDIPF